MFDLLFIYKLSGFVDCVPTERASSQHEAGTRTQPQLNAGCSGSCSLAVREKQQLTSVPVALHSDGWHSEVLLRKFPSLWKNTLKKNQQKEIRWNRGIVTLLLSPAQVYGKERQRHRLKLLWHFWLPSCHVFFFMMQLWPNGAWTAFSCLPRYIKSWCNLHTIKRRKPPLKTALSVDKTNLCCYA